MAKIKKIQEQGQTIYPATITNAVKDPGTGKTLTELLGDGVQSNGNYPKMSVGFSENVLGDGQPTEEAFSFRPTATENRNVRDGAARIERLKGSSVVWNNLICNESDANGTKGWSARQGQNNMVIDGDKVTILWNSEKSQIPQVSTRTTEFIGGHKYLIIVSYQYPNELTNYDDIWFCFSQSTNGQTASYSIADNFRTKDVASGEIRVIYEAKNNAPWLTLFFQGVSNYSFNDIGYTSTFSTEVHDLTQMFGAGNEPTTVEEFYERMPKGVDLNAYNEGEIINGNYGGIKTTGYNQFNGTYARVLGGAEYHLGGTYTSLGFATTEDGEVESIELPSDGLYTPSQNGYIFAQGENIDIHLNWSEYNHLNEDYHPYKSFERDLSWVVKYFPNGMRSAGNARDEIRFNSTTQKWEAVQRVGVVDLGRLGWRASGSAGADKIWNSTSLIDAYVRANNVLANITPSQFSPAPSDSVYLLKNDKTIGAGHHANGNYFTIYNSSYTTTADADAFIASIQGVMLNYELATPIVTEITKEDINLDFDASDYGTEELIAGDGGVSAPLVADIVYEPNVLATTKNQPDILKRLAALEAQFASLVSASAVSNE